MEEKYSKEEDPKEERNLLFLTKCANKAIRI